MRNFFGRWFGRGPSAASAAAAVPLSLQVAFSQRVCPLSPASLDESLHQFHPSLRKVAVSVTSYSDDGGDAEDGFIGSLQWTSPLLAHTDGGLVQHRIATVVQNNYQLPSDSPYRFSEHALAEDASLTDKLKETRSIVFLSYKGEHAHELTPLQQYAALSMVAGGIASRADSALAVLNIRAGCATPATLFTKDPTLQQGILADGTFDLAKQPRLASCFCGAGIVPALSDDGASLYCFRTYGAELLGRPNMMAYGTARDEEGSVFCAATTLWHDSLTNDTPLSAGQLVPMPRFVKSASSNHDVELCRPTLNEQEAMGGADVIVLKPVDGSWAKMTPLRA